MTTKLVNKIKRMLIEEDDNLKKYVLAYIVERYDNDEGIENFFSDLLRSGCQSGMIDTLIYYCDTHRFYDQYYNEIEELRLELEEDLGEQIKINGDLKNFFAWLAFEETAFRIADELELDI